MLSEEAETNFAKWLWFRHWTKREQPPRWPLRGHVCTEHSSLLSMFPDCFARKGIMKVTCDGRSIVPAPPLSSGNSWPQFRLYSASTSWSPCSCARNEDKFSPTSLICPCCTSFAHHSHRHGTDSALQSFSCFHLIIVKRKERKILCNLFKDFQRVHGHTSRTNKNLMWLFVTYCCMFPVVTWELMLSPRSRKTKSSGAILTVSSIFLSQS